MKTSVGVKNIKKYISKHLKDEEISGIDAESVKILCQDPFDVFTFEVCLAKKSAIGIIRETAQKQFLPVRKSVKNADEWEDIVSGRTMNRADAVWEFCRSMKMLGGTNSYSRVTVGASNSDESENIPLCITDQVRESIYEWMPRQSWSPIREHQVMSNEDSEDGFHFFQASYTHPSANIRNIRTDNDGRLTASVEMTIPSDELTAGWQELADFHISDSSVVQMSDDAQQAAEILAKDLKDIIRGTFQWLYNGMPLYVTNAVDYTEMRIPPVVQNSMESFTPNVVILPPFYDFKAKKMLSKGKYRFAVARDNSLHLYKGDALKPDAIARYASGETHLDSSTRLPTYQEDLRSFARDIQAAYDKRVEELGDIQRQKLVVQLYNCTNNPQHCYTEAATEQTGNEAVLRIGLLDDATGKYRALESVCYACERKHKNHGAKFSRQDLIAKVVSKYLEFAKEDI